jgi:hypothetical protein
MEEWIFLHKCINTPTEQHDTDDHCRMEKFLGKLERVVLDYPLPIVVGGDFNLIRSVEDESNDNINWPRVPRFY